MDCLSLFAMAAALTGENGFDPESEPIRRRAPALITAAAVSLHELDCAYRIGVLGEPLPDAGLPLPEIRELSDPLPVCDRLAPALACCVAALLVRDENRELSDSLSADFTALCAGIARSIPASVERIREIYA